MYENFRLAQKAFFREKGVTDALQASEGHGQQQQKMYSHYAVLF